MRLAAGALVLIAASLIAPPAQGVETCLGATATIVGTSGNDALLGTDGNDVIWAGDGNDTISGGAGFDRICMGPGNDTAAGGLGAENWFEPGPGDDFMAGNSGGLQDFIFYTNAAGPVVVDMNATPRATGEGSDDWTNIRNVQGTSYYDVLLGDANPNDFRGGPGNDQLRGGGGSDILIGGEGGDTMYGDAGADIVNGDAGNDSLYGGDDNDTIEGSDGDDLLVPGPGTDTVRAGYEICIPDFPCNMVDNSAADTLSYLTSASGVTVDLGGSTANGEGFDAVYGVERVLGSPFDDVITGNFAANYLFGNGGSDTLTGASGNDWFEPGAGDDIVQGGNGTDTVEFLSSAAGVTVNLRTGTASGQGTDVLTEVEDVIGTQYGDRLTGSAVANVLTGGLGNDVLTGLQGDDTYDGGGGVDTAAFPTAAAGVIANLGTGKASGDGADTLSSVERLTGSGRPDQLTGSGGANKLVGLGERDVLRGGGARDQLYGGAGDDRLVGGTGRDTCNGGPGKDRARSCERVTKVPRAV